MPRPILVADMIAGTALSLAILNSHARAVLAQGRPRLARGAVLALTLAALLALRHQSVPATRLLALPLLAAAVWASARERRWLRVFPLLQQLFALALLGGRVAL